MDITCPNAIKNWLESQVEDDNKMKYELHITIGRLL